MTMANKRITFRSTNVIGGIMLTITMMASLAAAATSKGIPINPFVLLPQESNAIAHSFSVYFLFFRLKKS